MRHADRLSALAAACAVACSTSPPPAPCIGCDGVAPSTFTLPASVPTACTGRTFFVVAKTTLCTSGPTYYLCDGSTYTEYDCANPGAGWSLETTAPDPGASRSASSSASTTHASSTATARSGDASLDCPQCDCDPQTEFCSIIDTVTNCRTLDGGPEECCVSKGCTPIPDACADAATCACIQKAIPSCFCGGGDGGLITSGCYE